MAAPRIVHFELRGVAPSLNVGGDRAYWPFRVGGVEVSIQLAAKDDADEDENALLIAETSRTVSSEVVELLDRRVAYLDELEAVGGRAGLDRRSRGCRPHPHLSSRNSRRGRMRSRRAVQRLVQSLRG